MNDLKNRIKKTPSVAATSFFIHRVEILISSRDEIKRCIAAKMENCRGDILGRLYCEYRCGNCIGVLGSKFYWRCVVGNNIYSMYTKMGG